MRIELNLHENHVSENTLAELFNFVMKMQYKLQSGMKLILECELFPYHINSPLPVIPFHDSTLISLFTNTKLLGCSLVLANASVVCIMDGLVQLGKMVLSAFQLILSSGGSCRPSDGSPRPHANFLHYI